MEISKKKLFLLLSLCSVLLLSACNQNEANGEKTDELEKIENLIQEEKEEASKQDSIVENVENTSINGEISEDESLNTYLTLKLNDILPRDPSIDNSVIGYELNFFMEFINHTDKDIKGFIAETYFYDMFDELVYTLDLKYEWETIRANDTTEFNTAVDLNQFKDVDMRFYNLPFENMTFKYKIKSIIFTDGTSI